MEAVKAIKKITFSKPGKNVKVVFQIPPPESAGRPLGWFQKRLREIPAVPEDHSSFRIKHPRTEEQLEIHPVHCLVKNTVCQPTPQVEANRQYQLDAILLFIKKGLVAPVHALKEGISSTGACRVNSIFCTQLGSNYSRPMGLTDNKRFAPSIHCNSGTESSSSGNAFPDGARDVNLSRNTDPCLEGGYLLAKRPSGRFCLPTISGPRKGWWVSPSSELEGPEQVNPRGALQDGGVPHGERSGEAGGLVSKDQFEGCLLSDPGVSLSPEVSPVYLEGKFVPVPMSSIRTLMCPPSVYESNEASSGLSQRKRNQIDNLFG